MTSILHNTTLSNNGRDTIWYRITAERIGHIGRLNVRTVKPLYVSADDKGLIMRMLSRPICPIRLAVMRYQIVSNLVVDRYQGIGIGIGRYHMVSVSADTAWYRWPIPIPQKNPTFDSQIVFELHLL